VIRNRDKIKINKNKLHKNKILIITSRKINQFKHKLVSKIKQLLGNDAKICCTNLLYSQAHESCAIWWCASAKSNPQGIVFLKGQFISKLI
jgi:hypothetical protein